MTKELLALLSSHAPNAIAVVAVVAILVAGYLGRLVVLLIKREIVTHQKLLKDAIEDNKATRAALAKHSEDMGKATKALHGDMLEIRREFLDLRQEVLNVKLGVNEGAMHDVR